jgi:hypothetical protein
VTTKRRPTLAQVRKWPATVPVPDAALALGFGRASLYEAIKRGESPVKTISVQRRVVVLTADLIRVLGGEKEDAA